MTHDLKIGFLTLAIAVSMGAAPQVGAQQVGRAANFEEPDADSLYYQQPSYRPDTRSIIHQKAQARAAERHARLESLNWYGMSNSRPTAAPTPFTSLYSPMWQMPGGRPYAWHPFARAPFGYYVR